MRMPTYGLSTTIPTTRSLPGFATCFMQSRNWPLRLQGQAALALHVMETVRHNWICPYHHERDKRGRINDVASNRKYHVTGTSFKRVVNSGKGGRPLVPKPKGFFHCGCSDDHVLADFFWWKSALITSEKSGEKEGWLTQRLDPRARGLMFNVWRRALRVQSIDEELYPGHELKGLKWELYITDKRIAHLQNFRDQMSRQDTREAVEEEGKASKCVKHSNSPARASSSSRKHRR